MADHASAPESPAERAQRGRGTSGTAARLPWPGLPPSARNRITLTALLVAVNLVLLLTIGIDGPRDSAGATRAAPSTKNLPGPKPYANVPPTGAAAPADRPQVSDQDALEQWSRRVSGKTDIPVEAVSAYGRAEMWMRSKSPECGISWATLAAIGALASEHGTDVEGQRQWQETVGPLRLRSGIWTHLAVRASGDGAAPEVWNIGDAALTAASYLCSRPESLREPRGWWDAVVAYRRSVRYAQHVFRTARRYALATR